MKQKILASSIAGIADLPAAAAAHAVEMKNWRAHQRRVAEDEKNGVPKERAHWPQPQPRAHPAVERAVDENDEANFEIVDDTLPMKKAALMAEVSRSEHEAILAVVPVGKRRAFDIRERDILAADHRLRSEINTGNGGIIRKVTGQQLSIEEIERAVVDARHPANTKHLADQATRRERIAEIERKAAQAHHDIEDLTAETIGGWKPPTF